MKEVTLKEQKLFMNKYGVNIKHKNASMFGIATDMLYYQLAKEYFDSIDAPKKELFTFEESAHSPNLEEPERFVKVVQSVAK